MTNDETAQFRAQLARLKQELQGLAAVSRESARPVALDQASVGRLTRMDAMQAQQMAREADRRREQQLVRIEGALRRMEAGEFGDCFVCGEAIDRRRLAVDPTHTRCTRCAQA